MYRLFFNFFFHSKLKQKGGIEYSSLWKSFSSLVDSVVEPFFVIKILYKSIDDNATL